MSWQKVLENGAIFLRKSTGNGSGINFLRYFGKKFGQFDLFVPISQRNRKQKCFLRYFSKNFQQFGQFFKKTGNGSGFFSKTSSSKGIMQKVSKFGQIF